MSSFDQKPILLFTTTDEWERWIIEVGDPAGVRLQLRKKSSPEPGITYDEALDVALCLGWIDGQVGRFDEHYTLQAFTPRRPRSPWSQRNQDHVQRLTAEGRMRPAGIAEVERAKADGRWDAAYRQKDAPVPDDLRDALEANVAASARFDTLNAQNRWAILFRLLSIKGEKTRAARIETYVEMLARGETIYPQ
ncbi:MAG: YdeI/OmpD-associated family protein [Rhodoglobus sp.]